MVVSEVRLRFDAMFRAFRFRMDGGADWSVVDDGTYETITSADRFLQYMRFGRGRADSTTRKYAEAIALYLARTAARTGANPTSPLSGCGCDR
jgi:integrase/recombinase XerD